MSTCSHLPAPDGRAPAWATSHLTRYAFALGCHARMTGRSRGADHELHLLITHAGSRPSSALQRAWDEGFSAAPTMQPDELRAVDEVRRAGDVTNRSMRLRFQNNALGAALAAWQRRTNKSEAPAPAPEAAAEALLRRALFDVIEPMLLSHLSLEAPGWREVAEELVRDAMAVVGEPGETVFGAAKRAASRAMV